MFKRRVSPPDFKAASRGLAIKAMPAPDEVILPLLQHTGAPGREQVSVKDKVKTGSLVARSKEYLSSPIHSSVSGEVKAIESRAHPILGQYKAIVIASDGRDEKDAAIKDRQNPDSLSADEIREIIRNCGIVGLGGAAFPTHVKLALPKDKPIDSLILNGAECEPYLTSDHRLMLERPNEIIAGMKIAMKAVGANAGFVAIEENKPEAINLFQKLTKGEIKVVSLKPFYPQGAEKQLIKTVLQREVSPGELPFEVGVVVHNVATCFAVYEAVYKNKPLYERVISVSGKILKRPANLLVRLGTKVKDVIEFCGGLIDEPGKIIFGGPMMGVTQYTEDAPIIKGTTGVIIFSKKESKRPLSQACIRCAKCIQVCPMGLIPSAIAGAVEKGRYDLAREYNALDCIECGLCSYLCPGNRDIVGLVKLAKQKSAKK